MEEGKGLGALGILHQVMHPRRVVEPVIWAPVDRVCGARQKRMCLVGARPVGGSVGPEDARLGVVVSGVVVRRVQLT